MIGKQIHLFAAWLLIALCHVPVSHGFQSAGTVNSIHKSDYNTKKRSALSTSFQPPPVEKHASSLSLNLFSESVIDGSMITAANDVSNINPDVLVFLAGVFPFAWATVEFSRRVMVGEAFGTGSDQIIIGMDDSPSDSRGRRVLGKGALITAIILFSISFATIGIVLYSVATSGAPPETLPESSNVVVDTLLL